MGPRIAVAGGVLVAGLFFAAVATATVPARFYSARPNAALAKFEKSLNRTLTSSNAACSFRWGNSRTGWHRVTCVASYTSFGTTYDVRIVARPRSCTHIRENITVFGFNHSRQTVAWPRAFTCKT